MAVSSIGLLHPGEMGAAVAAALGGAGKVVLWASEGRSADTARRAAEAGLVDAGSVRALTERCEVVLSICPPAAALETARSVSGFDGLYVDANAIAPATADAVAAEIEAGGGRYVDGGIVGLPPRPGRPVALYLSGPEAAEVAAIFVGTPVIATVLAGRRTAASALKACFAAWTKASGALLLAIRALARAEGVEEALLEAWAERLPELEPASRRAARQAGAKAWRFVGEMEEIARTFEAAGLPGGFHEAAAEVFARLPRIRGTAGDDETLAAVLGALRAALAAPPASERA